MAKTCVGCAYYRSLSENSPNLQPYCNYLLDTGEPRGCPAENCKKKNIYGGVYEKDNARAETGNNQAED